MEIDKVAVRRANNRLFEAGLKGAYFSAITDRLVEKGLITKKEEKMIRRKIDKIREEALSPTIKTPSKHAQEITCTEALPDDVVRTIQRQKYIEERKKRQKIKR